MTNEWTNLAPNVKYAKVIRDHARWLPKVNEPPALGSAQRVLWREGSVWLWEGKPIIAAEKEE